MEIFYYYRRIGLLQNSKYKKKILLLIKERNIPGMLGEQTVKLH